MRCDAGARANGWHARVWRSATAGQLGLRARQKPAREADQTLYGHGTMHYRRYRPSFAPQTAHHRRVAPPHLPERVAHDAPQPRLLCIRRPLLSWTQRSRQWAMGWSTRVRYTPTARDLCTYLSRRRLVWLIARWSRLERVLRSCRPHVVSFRVGLLLHQHRARQPSTSLPPGCTRPPSVQPPFKHLDAPWTGHPSVSASCRRWQRSVDVTRRTPRDSSDEITRRRMHAAGGR